MRFFVTNLYFWLILILLGGFLIRLYKIDNPVADWHSWRQADTASVTRIYVNQGIDVLHPRYYDISYLQTGKPNPNGWRFVEFPIFNVVHAILYEVYSRINLEEWGRLLSVFCSLVSAFVIFLIGRRFLGGVGGLIASIVFCFMPYNVYFSRVILPEPAGVMFALIGLYFFVRWFDQGLRTNIIFSAASFSLALLLKPYLVFYFLPVLWLAGEKYSWKLKTIIASKELWIFILISFIPLMAWRLWMIKYPEGIPFYKWVFNSDNIRFKPAFWHWIIGERLGKMILGIWGVFLFVAGILAPARKNDRTFLVLLAVGMFLYVSTITSANVRHDYYQTLVIPSICLIIARGFVWLLDKNIFGYSSGIIASVVLLLSLLLPWYDIKELYKIDHPEIIEAGQTLDRIAPKDALVIAPYDGDTAFLYQTKRFGWPYQTNSIEEMIQQGAKYYVSVNLNDPQTQDAARKFEVPIQTDKYIIIDLSKHRKPQ